MSVVIKLRSSHDKIKEVLYCLFCRQWFYRDQSSEHFHMSRHCITCLATTTTALYLVFIIILIVNAEQSNIKLSLTTH